MLFRVLGPVAHHVGGQWVQAGGALRRRLLAVLLARAGQLVSHDQLAEALWQRDADARAQQRLHVHVHRLRAELEQPELLIGHEGAYELRPPPGSLDAQRFEEQADRASASQDETVRAEAALAALREWPAGWSVRAYDSVDVAVCRDEAERLEALRIDVAELYLTAEVQRGRHLDVLPELAALARLHPLRESMQAQLMRALHQAGRRHEALEV
ncbi:AfsR/SARP family transcriptional regulator, partial [Pseudactinotalea sp.]|uniref:AfsR/SARP family transcriptional regulator n=1 Tax=Pseudactinotalea sp. TaxID=1926260 RepID=UPI003B3B7D47